MKYHFRTPTKWISFMSPCHQSFCQCLNVAPISHLDFDCETSHSTLKWSTFMLKWYMSFLKGIGRLLFLVFLKIEKYLQSPATNNNNKKSCWGFSTCEARNGTACLSSKSLWKVCTDWKPAFGESWKIHCLSSLRWCILLTPGQFATFVNSAT